MGRMEAIGRLKQVIGIIWEVGLSRYLAIISFSREKAIEHARSDHCADDCLPTVKPTQSSRGVSWLALVALFYALTIVRISETIDHLRLTAIVH